jgi:hypothetical protein
MARPQPAAAPRPQPAGSGTGPVSNGTARTASGSREPAGTSCLRTAMHGHLSRSRCGLLLEAWNSSGAGVIERFARRPPGGPGHDGERMGLRVLSGRPPLPWFARWRTVLVACDLDADAGIAAVRVVIRSGWLSTVDDCSLYERHGDGWQSAGGSRSTGREGIRSGTQPGGVLVRQGGAAVLSYRDRTTAHSPGTPFTDVGWVACAIYHAASSVTHLSINGRLITVPAHGHVLVAWKAPPSSSPPWHPHVVAVGQDGGRLAEFGPSNRPSHLTA